jgi:hypothetical protein
MRPPDVAYGSIAAETRCPHQVRFPSDSNQIANIRPRQRRAKRRHYAAQQSTSAASAGSCGFSPLVGVGCKAWAQSRRNRPPAPSVPLRWAHRQCACKSGASVGTSPTEASALWTTSLVFRTRSSGVPAFGANDPRCRMNSRNDAAAWNAPPASLSLTRILTNF